MLIGYFNHMVYFFGHLTVGRMRNLRRQHEYSRRAKQIQRILDEWEVKKDVKKATLEYYKALWTYRSGIKDMPKCFNILPAPMQKEITCDIFWEALRHSSIFSDCELPLKRAISLVMKSEFYLTGDYVYKIRHYKTKMIYIASGIVQVSYKYKHT